MNLVAGKDRFAESAIVDRHEIDQLACHLRAQRLDNQHGRRLRHGFDDQNAGHDGSSRKVPEEVGLVDRHILDPSGALVPHQIDHAINHEEGIAMGNGRNDLFDVQPFNKRTFRYFIHRLNCVS